MSITRYFDLQLNAGKKQPLVFYVNQYDSSETWVFTLYDEYGQQYTPSAGSIIGVKADGHAIATATGVTVNGSGQVVVTETQQMTAAAGNAEFELSIDNGVHGTANFFVIVEKKPSENAILSDSDLSLIQQALDVTNPAIVADIVSDWLDDNASNATIVYVSGDTLYIQTNSQNGNEVEY